MIEAIDLAVRLLVPALALDARGRVLLVNEALGGLLGHGLADAAPGARCLDAGRLRAWVAAGAREGAEIRFQAAGDREVILSLSLALRDAGGGIVAIATDVTAARQRERTVTEELDRYLDIISAASDIAHETLGSTEGEIRLFFPRRQAGRVAIREVRARWPEQCADPGYDAEGYRDWLERIAAHEPYRDSVHRVPRKDGREQYYRTSAVPFYDRRGAFKGYRGVSIDVTAQVVAERALQQSEARLRRSEEHLARAQKVANTGSIDRDIRTGAVEWSEEMFRLVGLDPQTTPQTEVGLLRFVHPMDRPRFGRLIERVNAGEQSAPFEFRVMRADGEERILYLETELFRDAQGAPERLLSVVKDVTELRRRIGELEEARRQLEHQSRQLRAAAFELERARDLAQAANRTKSTFLANMSHELRTPLNAIIGFSTIMRDGLFGELPAKYRDYATDILSSGEHLLDLINQILDLSKIEAGKAELVETTVVPASLVAGCARLMRDRADAAGLILEQALSPDLPAIRADELKFKQVLINLLSNAVKFTRPGGRITVAAWVDGRGFALEVRDTGIGMRPEEIPLALQPFRQVGDRRLAAEAGTGLGLPLAKSLVELHGGALEIESEMARGTVVRIRLPGERIIDMPQHRLRAV